MIPSINIKGKYIPEVWEKIVLEVYDCGCDIKTEYDKKDDPPSKDASVTLTIKHPAEEPMFEECAENLAKNPDYYKNGGDRWN